MTDRLLDRFFAASRTTVLVEVRPDGRVASANSAFAAQVKRAENDVSGSEIEAFPTNADAERLDGWLADGPPSGTVRMNFVASDGVPRTFRCLVEATEPGLSIVGEPEETGDRAAATELMRLNNELATMARERGRRERELQRTRDQLEHTLEDLKASYWHLKKIQEVMPLCMRCGKIKAAEAQWQSVVDYLKDNAIFLSHGYCPTCADQVLEDYGLNTDAGI